MVRSRLRPRHRHGHRPAGGPRSRTQPARAPAPRRLELDARGSGRSRGWRLEDDVTTDGASAVQRFLAAEAAGALVLEGLHAVKHALRFGHEPLALLSPDPDRLAELAAELAPDLTATLASAEPITGDQAAGLARRLASPCLAVVARPSSPPLPDWDDRAPVVVVERPRHAGNLGAVARVVAAAGAAGLVVVDGPSPWDRAVVRASAGLVLCVPVLAVRDVTGLVARTRSTGRELVALDPAGEAWPGPLRRQHRTVRGEQRAPVPAPAVAFGSERHGLSADLHHAAVARVALGMRPGVSSLNLATAVSGVLYALGAPWPAR